MEQGSLPERYLARSILKHVRKQNKGLVTGAAVGNDYALLTGQVSTEAAGKTPLIAWTKAMNNFACSGGIVEGARLLFLMPICTKESRLKQYMSEFNAMAEEARVQILGGHSEISETFSEPRFVVTLLGKEGSFRQNKKGIKEGFDIIMTARAGLMGTDLIARENIEVLKSRFAESYIKSAFRHPDEYGISKAAAIAAEYGVCYMHDVSHGGVYGALWQLGVWMGRGFEVNHFAIPIRQESIEICEFFNINPYMLDGTGSLLAVLEQGEDLAKEFARHGIEAAVIGKVTAGKEKLIVMNDADKRCLSPVNGDMYYQLKEKR